MIHPWKSCNQENASGMSPSVGGMSLCSHKTYWCIFENLVYIYHKIYDPVYFCLRMTKLSFSKGWTSNPCECVHNLSQTNTSNCQIESALRWSMNFPERYQRFTKCFHSLNALYQGRALNKVLLIMVYNYLETEYSLGMSPGKGGISLSILGLRRSTLFLPEHLRRSVWSSWRVI